MHLPGIWNLYLKWSVVPTPMISQDIFPLFSYATLLVVYPAMNNIQHEVLLSDAHVRQALPMEVGFAAFVWNLCCASVVAYFRPDSVRYIWNICVYEGNVWAVSKGVNRGD